MTRTFVLRALRVAVAAGLGVAGLAVAAPPAGAVQRPVLSVGVGETVVNKYPALVGANYQQGRRPTSCSASTRISCDTIPIVLSIDQAELDANPSDYLLLVETNWNVRTTQTVPAVGSPSDDQVNTYVYKNPPRETVEEDAVTGEETRTQVEENSAFLNPPPTSLSFSPVETTSYLVTVENMFGYNDGYTLTVSFLYTGGDAPVDLSIDDQPFDFSETEQFDVTPSFNDLSPTTFDTVSGPAAAFADLGGFEFGTPVAAPAGRTFNLDVAEVGVDPDLDALAGVDNAAVLKLQEAQEVQNIGISGPPRIRDASGLVLALWLLVLPVIGGGVIFFFAFRRRAALAGMA